MKTIILAGVLASMILSVRAQSPQNTPDSPPVAPTPPTAPMQRRVGIDGSMTITPDMTTTNNIGAQTPANTAGAQTQTMGTQTPLPATGLASGTATNQLGVQNGNTQLHIQAMTATDQPIATQVQQVLVAEPVLAQTLPGLNIQVNGGVVILNGDVQCGAESVLVQNLIYQKLPRTVRIENRMRLSGAMAPAYLSH